MQVTAILEASRTWAEFRDQKHDLFIPSAAGPGRLMEGGGVAGYLTGPGMGPGLLPRDLPPEP